MKFSKSFIDSINKKAKKEEKEIEHEVKHTIPNIYESAVEWSKKDFEEAKLFEQMEPYNKILMEIKKHLIGKGKTPKDSVEEAKKIIGPYNSKIDYTKKTMSDFYKPESEEKEKKPEPPKDTRKLRAMLSELYDDLRHDMTEAEQYKYNRLHRDEKFESLYEFMLDVKERIKIDNVKKEEAEHHRRKKEQEEWEESRKKAEAKKAEDAIRVKKEIDELLKSLPKEPPIPKAKKGKAKKRTMITKAVVARKEMPHDSHKGRWTKEELYHFYNEHKYIPPFKNGNPRKITIEQLNTYMRKPAWKRRPKGKANEHFKKVKSTVSEDNLFYA